MNVADQVLEKLAIADVVGIDVETSGLDWRKNFICGYVFTFGPGDDDTYYVPVRHKGGGNIEGCRIPTSATDWSTGDDHPFEIKLREAVRSKPRLWYGHNIKFDLHFLAKHGIWIYGECEDTYVNASLIDENAKVYNLNACCVRMGVTPKVDEIYAEISKYMLSRGVKIPATRGSMAHFWEMPAQGIATEYAAGDGVSTARLRDAQLLVIVEQNLGTVHAVEKRVTRTLFRMEHRGVPVDVKVLKAVKEKVSKLLREAQERIPQGMNVRSPQQLYKYYKSLGYTDEQFARTENKKKDPLGAVSFTEEWLTEKGGEFGADLINIRKFSNLINTFIVGAIEKHLHNGRVFPTFNQAKGDEFGVVTGRLSCSEPNFQQIPKRHKILAPTLRQIFRQFGMDWCSADYSQQEYRVFAEYAQAKYVLEAYDRDPNTDYHQLVADLLGVERDPAAKRINLGVIYNMGIDKLAASLGVPRSVAEGYMRKLHRQMPEAKKFNKACQQVAESRGYVRTLLKRRRRFPNGHFAHKAGNAVIQGSSADITKLKMADCDDYLMGDAMEFNIHNSKYKSSVILQIHDSLEFLRAEGPEETAAIEHCLAIMIDFGADCLINLKVPMKADFGHGISWGHATFGSKFKDWVNV